MIIFLIIELKQQLKKMNVAKARIGTNIMMRLKSYTVVKMTIPMPKNNVELANKTPISSNSIT